MKKKKIIGIIGGMGPSASGYLYNLINSLAIREYGVKRNDEFPETILYSVPVPDFISSNRNRKKALLMLQERVRQMNNFPIKTMGIACNTAHILLPELQKYTHVQFVSMIGEVVEEVSKKGLKKVGLLATSSTIQSKLYQNALQRKGIEVTLLSRKYQKDLDEIIKSTVGERAGQKNEEKLVAIANTLTKKGIEALILGCTELPLVFPHAYMIPVVNSAEILARALLRETML